jgi:DNA-binding transcriptional regulator YbjK
LYYGSGYAPEVPPLNMERRRALADAAIEILGSAGVHALSHRALDERAGLPAGTASNYFRSREALLAAAAERVVELHLAEMAQADALVRGPIAREGLIELIAASLLYSATAQRTRYLAVYELTLEATRRPELRAAFTALADSSLRFTLDQHRRLGLDTTAEQVQQLITLFGGALFTLTAALPHQCTPDAAAALARALVTGVLGPQEPAGPS